MDCNEVIGKRRTAATVKPLPEHTPRAPAGYWDCAEISLALSPDAPAQFQVQQRRGSLLAFVGPRAGRPQAVIKVYGDSRGFQNAYLGLNLAAAVSDSFSQVRSPTILQTIRHLHTIVMEYVEGVTVRSVIRRQHGIPPQSHLSAARSLGQWLSRFHRSRYQTSTSNDHVDRYCESVIESLQKRQRWLGRSRYNTGLGIVETIRKSLHCRTKLLVQCHGDFTVGNIIAADDNLCVIDFADSGLGFPELDLASLRVSLRRAAGTLPSSKAAVETLWSTFMAGYDGEHRIEVDAMVSDLCELYLLTVSLTELFDYPSLGPLKKLRKSYLFLQTLRDLRSWLDERADGYGVAD